MIHTKGFNPGFSSLQVNVFIASLMPLQGGRVLKGFTLLQGKAKAYFVPEWGLCLLASSEVMGGMFLFKKNSLCGAGSPWLQLHVLPQWHLLCPQGGQGHFCNAQVLQGDQSLGRKPGSLRNPPGTGGAAKEGSSWLGQSHSSEQLPWEGSSLQLQLVLEIFHVLAQHSLFVIVLCWAQTEAHYCLLFSQMEFLPLYQCISGISRLRNFPGSCI